MRSFDVAVIGGGPGGYVAAIRSAQLGARTAIVEKDRFGGTCLVRGCIPTKALLQSAELYSLLSKQGPEFGLKTSDLSFDLAAAQKRRIKIVDKLVSGVEGLLRANQVEIISGLAQLTKPGQFTVEGQNYTSRDIIIATGSTVSQIPLKGAELTIDSDQILELQQIPESMVVIGGGVVGMEWGALYAALGTKVTVLEMLPQILPMVELELAQSYRRHFEKIGGVIHSQAKVQSICESGRSREVSFTADGEEQRITGEVVLMAVGRRPATSNLGLERVGAELERGRVVVDKELRAGDDGLWAIGDVIGGIMLAHVASYEGVCAAENLQAARGGGKLRQPDYHAAPNCIYTDPEIAHVGLSEQAAREAGYQITVGRFPLAASGRALTLGQAEGSIKVVAEASSGTLLGVHMLGPRVTDVIA
ncbi:MAG: dihydrolipoyl dehydrogenase, partial [Candidatus Dormibacteraceae bacterium]